MSTVIKIKYSDLTAQPAADLLQIAEPAYSFTNGGRLFFGADDGAGGTTPHVIGGKYFADKLDHTPGTLTANSAIIVDDNSKIDILNIDNITIDGNTISSTDNNGNIILDPNGIGVIQLAGPLELNAGQSLILNDLTAGRVVFVGSSQELTDDANFAWDDTSDKLTIVGALQVDNLSFGDGVGSENTIKATNVGGSIVLTANGNGYIDLGNNNTVLKIPQGVIGTRPTASGVGLGSIRYNTTDHRFEGVRGASGGEYRALTRSEDTDWDTYVDAEQNPDDDTLRLVTAGVERMNVNATAVSTSVEARFPKLTVDFGGTNYTIIDGSTITLNGGTIEGTGNASTGTIVVDPAPAAGDAGGEFIVRGNLQVTGTTTTVESTVVSIADPVIELGENTSSDALDRGIIAKFNDGAAKEAFIGWDRGVDNNFTFQIDGTTSDAKFADLKLTGSIVEVDGTTPANGHILMGNGINGDLELNTITAGDSIRIINSAADIEIDVKYATTVATVDPFSEDVTAGSFEVGVQYTIVSVGTTDYTLIGSADNLIGTVFTATGVGTGDGVARSLGNNYYSDTTPAAISVANVTVGDYYTITTLGTTSQADWNTLAGTSGVTYVGGETFVAAFKGTAGTGTVTPTDTSAGNAQYRGAASFAAEQFTVTDGHVVITEIDGGTF